MNERYLSRFIAAIESRQYEPKGLPAGFNLSVIRALARIKEELNKSSLEALRWLTRSCQQEAAGKMRNAIREGNLTSAQKYDAEEMGYWLAGNILASDYTGGENG